MILYLDTSTGTCRLWLDETAFEWEANRELALKLLGFLDQSLKSVEADFSDISGIVSMKGPGSFTGLRIGITVLNTIAYSNDVPIVGETGEGWRTAGKMRLEKGENDQIVLPLYGSEPNISTPKH